MRDVDADCIRRFETRHTSYCGNVERKDPGAEFLHVLRGLEGYKTFKSFPLILVDVRLYCFLETPAGASATAKRVNVNHQLDRMPAAYSEYLH
jgi:hypothetical protein